MTAIGPGTRVKCIKRDEWRHTPSSPPVPGPDYDSVWTVKSLLTWEGYPCLTLSEWTPSSDNFLAKWFVPLDEIELLREIAREAANPDANLEPERIEQQEEVST